MKIYQKILTNMFFFGFMFVGCSSSCTNSNGVVPNIREQPGIEFCPIWCAKMEELAHNSIKEPNPELCAEYLKPIFLQEDAGALDCVQFCEYEYKNSVYLNAECMSQVTQCSQVECASQLVYCSEIPTKCK